jgi:DNA-binding CsgD family transcriptional regulator
VGDVLALVTAIYDAVGDANRWQQLEQRLSLTSPERAAEVEPHLQLARRLHQQHVRVAQSAEVLAAVHDLMAFGALVVDEQGMVVRANSAARRLLTSGAGLRLADERVEAIDAVEQTNLQTAIAAVGAEAPAADVFVVITRPGRRPLCVIVLPGGRHDANVFEQRRLALLLIIDFDAPGAAATKLLRSLFDFTPREADLAAELMEGRTVAQAARRLGISVTTARTFLSRLTAKTDSHSQADLVRRLLAVPPMV